jgi:protein SCO1/2
MAIRSRINIKSGEITVAAFLLAGVYPIAGCGPRDADFARAVAETRAAGLTDIDTSNTADRLPYYTQTTLDPVWDASHPAIATIPDYNFRNQADRVVTGQALDGRITVACFFFTRCNGYCPNIMRNMQRVQQAFANDPGIYLLSHSVTPDLDSPDALRSYQKASGFGGPDWDLVTGPRELLYALARETYNADTAEPGQDAQKRKERDFIHSEHIYIIDGRRRIRGIYNGNLLSSVPEIVRDIRRLQKQG